MNDALVSCFPVLSFDTVLHRVRMLDLRKLFIDKPIKFEWKKANEKQAIQF